MYYCAAPGLVVGILAAHLTPVQGVHWTVRLAVAPREQKADRREEQKRLERCGDEPIRDPVHRAVSAAETLIEQLPTGAANAIGGNQFTFDGLGFGLGRIDAKGHPEPSLCLALPKSGQLGIDQIVCAGRRQRIVLLEVALQP